MKRKCPECGRPVPSKQQTIWGFPMMVGTKAEGFQPVLEFKCRCGFLCVLAQELAEAVETLPREKKQDGR